MLKKLITSIKFYLIFVTLYNEWILLPTKMNNDLLKVLKVTRLNFDKHLLPFPSLYRTSTIK